MEEKHNIILFDGICNLCNAAINLVIERDKKDIFKFATLQSDIGQELTSNYKIDSSKVDSIILIDGEKHYTKSTAALRIAKQLSGAYPLLYGFVILPKPFRDVVYDYIARNRYKWFGKMDNCRVPTPELIQKFL